MYIIDYCCGLHGGPGVAVQPICRTWVQIRQHDVTRRSNRLRHRMSLLRGVIYPPTWAGLYVDWYSWVVVADLGHGATYCALARSTRTENIDNYMMMTVLLRR